MMTEEQLILLAKQAGFTYAVRLDPDTLSPQQDVRNMCRNGCHRYDTCWSCPPGCGTLEQCRHRLSAYAKGILVQTVGHLEDEFDGEGMMQTQSLHNSRFAALVQQLRGTLPELLPLGAGCCEVCKDCTYPDNPCRFPHKQVSSMEAYGLLVQQLCKANDLSYYYGSGTIAYCSCILW